VPEGSIVLDIGCNDGSLGLRLQDKGCVVYAVDVVKELVAVAQSRGLIANVGRADKLEYKDRKFDVVVMAEVMEHLFNPDDALREIARVLDKDGLFVGSVPHDKGHLGEGKKADYHNWIFSKADLEAMFGKYFKEVEITETEYSKDFCDESNVPLDLKQWNNWICEGVR
jgi:2-polyprenyl-3-methyl-5-hydroxy-6-metoxy-1,4-benzoquinol methylase